MEHYVDKGIQRSDSLHPGRDRFSARTFHSSSGPTVLVDSIAGFDGIPIGVPNRRTAGQKKKSFRLRRSANFKKWISMSVVFRYPVSFFYVLGLAVTGAYLQGWLTWILG